LIAGTSSLVRWLTARNSGASERRHRVLPPVVRIAGVVLVAAFATYLAGMNLFLRTRLFRSVITSASGSLLVDYREAHSLWPGRIHVEGLVIRGRDSSVEWILSLDRCDFHVSFLALARRRFHASHVNGDGLSLRVRLRRDGPVSPDEMRALPPVPGFLDPPLKAVGPPLPELTDANYNLWSIQLDDVDADHVRELWIDTVRYAGDVEVRGRWFFRPLRWLDIGPATVDLRALDVGYGVTETWLSGMAGELTATIQPFALQEVVGAAMVDRVSVDGDVRGTARMATVLGRLLGSDDRASPIPRADDAPLEARLHLDHGVLRSGTQVHLDRFAADVRSGPIVVETSVTAQARVDDGDTTHLNVDCAACRLTNGAEERVHARSLVASVETHGLDLARLGDPFDVRGSLDGEDLDVVFDGTALAVPRFSIAATKGRFGAGEGPLAGEFTVAADALSGEHNEVKGKADLSARLVVSRTSAPAERIELSGSALDLRAAHLTIKGTRVAVPALRVRAHSLSFVASRPVGRVAVDVPDVDVPLSLVPNALLLLPRVVSIESGHAHAALSADVDLDHLAATGEAHVVTQGLRAHVGEEAVAGELRLDVHAREGEGATVLSDGKLTFDGTVGDPAASWWARATLAQALLDARSGLRFRAHVMAAAKNGAPLVAVVAKGTAIPAWVLNLVSTQDLTGAGDLVISPSTFQLRSVTAHAAGVDLGFELAELGAEREWALLLDVGLVSAGIDVANGQTDVLLFGATSWFAKKAASLRAIEQRYE
jgi:hypothetical protein